MELREILRGARQRLQAGWNALGPKQLVAGWPVLCAPASAKSIDVLSALQLAAPGEWVEAFMFLDGLVEHEGGGLVSWEAADGRTQQDVLDLFNRAILRASRIAA